MYTRVTDRSSSDTPSWWFDHRSPLRRTYIQVKCSIHIKNSSSRHTLTERFKSTLWCATLLPSVSDLPQKSPDPRSLNHLHLSSQCSAALCSAATASDTSALLLTLSHSAVAWMNESVSLGVRDNPAEMERPQSALQSGMWPLIGSFCFSRAI